MRRISGVFYQRSLRQAVHKTGPLGLSVTNPQLYRERELFHVVDNYRRAPGIVAVGSSWRYWRWLGAYTIGVGVDCLCL